MIVYLKFLICDVFSLIGKPSQSKMDAFFCIISIESSSISTMCKRKHLIWLFRASPPTSKIKCYPSFPPYSQTLSLWSLLIHMWVDNKIERKKCWSCFVFFGNHPSIHALLFQISRFQFISQFVVQIVDLELKYFTIKKYFVKFYLFSPECLNWTEK